MKTHYLKTLPEFFQKVDMGLKTFEARKNDRDFKEDDILILEEYHSGQYTGRVIVAAVSYILHGGMYGVEQGHCIMAITKLRKNF